MRTTAEQLMRSFGDQCHVVACGGNRWPAAVWLIVCVCERVYVVSYILCGDLEHECIL